MSGVGSALLAICAAPEGDHAALLSKLDGQSWNELVELAGRTRTVGLLSRSIDQCSALPTDSCHAATRIGELAQLDAMAALAQGQASAQVVEKLQRHGIEPIALKGLSLAFRDYPDPATRPLRDLDLLLRPDDALAANELLLADPRFKQREGVAIYGLEYGHQLPEIEEIESGLVIELHHRINARGWDQEPRLVEMIHSGAGSLGLLGQRVRVPSPHHNVLHLIEHATFHHLFANGPLILSDLHYLFTRNNLDQDQIWQDAEGLGLGRSLALLAHLAKRLGATWVQEDWLARHNIGPSMLDHACSSMLEGREETEQIAMLRRLDDDGEGATSSGKALLQMLRPSANQLSRLSGRRSDSPLRWLGYPAWLREKGRRYFSAIRAADLNAKSRAREELACWLRIG